VSAIIADEAAVPVCSQLLHVVARGAIRAAQQIRIVTKPARQLKVGSLDFFAGRQGFCYGLDAEVADFIF
jgi:hypothetical protein